MKQYEITGLGPMNEVTGIQKIFTRLTTPFEVNKEWLAAQTGPLAVGDFIEVAKDGKFSLVSSAEGTQRGEDKEPAAIESKATTGPMQQVSAGQQETEEQEGNTSPFKQYSHLPIVVSAAEIKEVDEPDVTGHRIITFADGGMEITDNTMHDPVVGDYWIIENRHGETFEYTLPKANFEARFTPVPAGVDAHT